MNPDLQGWATLILGVLVFPFMGYFFKKNDRLHETMQNTQSIQDVKIAVIETRVGILEGRGGYNTTTVHTETQRTTP